MSLYIQSAAAAAAAALCVATLLLLLLPQLLLFVILCRMAKIVACSMNLNRQLSLHEHLLLVGDSIPSVLSFYLFGVPFFFTSFLFGAVWFHNRVPLGPDIPGIILLLYDVSYVWHAFIQSAAAAAAAPCVAIFLLLR